MLLDELLRLMIDRKASDMQIKVGRPPILRIAGKISTTEFEKFSAQDTKEIAYNMMNEDQRKRFEDKHWIDLSYSVYGVSRFRVNVFYQRGTIAIVFRAISFYTPTIDELLLPSILKDLVLNHNGLILVTGPSGSGKSTTLAAMINHINETNPCHILTLEDPIEFLFKDNISTITQRELGSDTFSFEDGLMSLFRQDPDVILIGEMRDVETFKIGVKAAETGHLVLSTLHTASAAQTISRILNVFPPEQHQQIRIQLSIILRGIISQKLVNRADGNGRIAATEVMINSSAIKKLIEENNIQHITETIYTSVASYRMQTLEQSLAALIKNDVITYKDAQSAANNLDGLKRALRSLNMDEQMLENEKG